MRKNVLFLIIIVAFSSFQCSSEKRTPNNLESYLIKKLDAKDVTIIINNRSILSNGTTTQEKFLFVELDKPKVLLDVKYNERIYNNYCNILRNYLLDSVKFDTPLEFDELRLKIIETDKFFIFTDEKYDLKTYRR